MKVAMIFPRRVVLLLTVVRRKEEEKKMLVPTRVVFVDIENFYDYSFCKVLYQ